MVSGAGKIISKVSNMGREQKIAPFPSVFMLFHKYALKRILDGYVCQSVRSLCVFSSTAEPI